MTDNSEIITVQSLYFAAEVIWDVEPQLGLSSSKINYKNGKKAIEIYVYRVHAWYDVDVYVTCVCVCASYSWNHLKLLCKLDAAN